MNSLELPQPFHLSSDTSHWEAVRQIYRRMLVLRATGRPSEAEFLQHEYQQAVASARCLSESDTEEALVLAAENDRVASAVLLAEILAPLLVERLGHRLSPGTVARTPAVPEQGQPLVNAESTVPPRPADGGVPGIADLIDGMLAQESPHPQRFVHR